MSMFDYIKRVFKHISKRSSASDDEITPTDLSSYNISMYEMEGEPIPVHTEVVIHHKRSGKSLYSESHPYPNDFGVEYEVSCFTQASAKRKQILKHEKAGTLTSQSSSKHYIQHEEVGSTSRYRYTKHLSSPR
eukprot:1333212-Amorphochlora_amoeboformis.AAC.1